MRTGTTDVFSFYLPTRIIHGPGSIRQTGGEFKNLGAAKCLLVTDQGVRMAGLLEGVLQSLEASSIPYVVFDEVEEDPGGTTVARGAEMAVREKCNGIVVVGGGSPICAGRAIGVVATNKGAIKDYAGLGKASLAPLPLIAVPTTAGSGAEVSQFIVLKDEERHAKMVVGSPLYFPRVAILDPMLIRTMSPRLAAVSGVDALTHAIEAYLTTMTTPITDALALSAVRLIHNHLRAAALSDDLEAKESCLIGSTMANMACGNARLGLVHGLTNPMEGMFKIPHGIAVGTLLPYAMAFNLPAGRQRFADLAGAMGEDHRAERALPAIKKLYMDLGFPSRYAESQIDRKAVPQIVKMAMAGLYGVYDPDREYPMNAPLPSVNIRKATMKDAIDLLERAFEGWGE